MKEIDTIRDALGLAMEYVGLEGGMMTRQEAKLQIALKQALAALSTIDPDAETGWLIESTEAQKSFFVRWGYMSDTRPAWWTGVDEDVATNDNPSWTQDSLEAVRFARKTDAEKIILGWGYSLENQWTKVTEHRWD